MYLITNRKRPLASRLLIFPILILLSACDNKTGEHCSFPKVIIDDLEYPGRTNSTLTYDKKGNVTSELVNRYRAVNGVTYNETTVKHIFTYDTYNHKLTEKKFAVFDDGRPPSETSSTIWEYDEQGRMLSEITDFTYANKSDRQETYYTYDQSGNELSYVNYDYNASAIALPGLTNTRNSTYDIQGNRLTFVVETKNLTTGNLWSRSAVLSTFDSSNNAISKEVTTFSSYYGTATPVEGFQSTTWTYDENNNKLTQTSSRTTLHWSYDDSGKPLSEQRRDIGENGSIEKQFDTQWTYNTSGQNISKTTDSDFGTYETQQLFGWNYNELGLLQSTVEKYAGPHHEENTVTTWTYDSLGRVLTNDSTTDNGSIVQNERKVTYEYNSCYTKSGLSFAGPSLGAPPISYW